MTDEITIRVLGPDDLDLLLSVGDDFFDNPVDSEQARAFLDDPLHEIVIAYADDVAVGFASGTVLLHPDKQPSMFINEVETLESWRRRGIAKAVTQRLIEVARGRGCQGVWLGTEADNAPAIALYEAMRGEALKGVYFGWDDAF